MSTKFPKTKITENQGMIYVQEVLNECKCIFNKVDGSNDVGLDGYLEFSENESMTGLCVAIQIKSGDSNLNSDGSISLKSDKSHFEFWNSHILPIIGVVYIPKQKTAYWIDITYHLKDDNIISNGPYSIRVPSGQIFSIERFENLYTHLKKYKNVYRSDSFFGKAIADLVNINPYPRRYTAIKSLFSYQRDRLETWFYLINQFKIESDVEVQKILLYCFRHIVSHGDVYWHKGNIIDHEIRLYARGLIKQMYNFDDLYKLICLIGEDGISRGSIGQDIYEVISLIPNPVEGLKKIILNVEVDDDTRFWTAVILIDHLQDFDIERALNMTISMISNFPNSANLERYNYICQTLLDCGQVDFRG